MKKSSVFFTAVALVFAAACNQPKTETTDETTEVTEEIVEEVEEMKTENPEGYYGRVIEAEGATSIDEFAKMMDGKDSLQVKLLAVAEDVCQKKGCWMKVKTADGNMMRIKFKDYGFFVPKDITGKEVVFEGVAFRDTTSVDDLRHYAEDGGKTAEEIAAITQPEINTSFIADGVVIVQ